MITEKLLARYLTQAGGDVMLASVMAGITAAEFSDRLKESSIIQYAQAEVGADNLVVEPDELLAALDCKQPWAIMFQLENSGRYEREQPKENLN